MTGETTLTGPAALHDEAFFDRASVEIGTAFMVRRALGAGRAGVLLDAPRALDPGRHPTLPVLGVWCRTLRENLTVAWTDRAAVVAVRLEDGLAVAGRALPWKQSEEFPEALDEDPGEGFAADAFVCDLRARAPRLPWTGGTWAITVLLDRYASPPTFTHLAGPPPSRAASPSPPTTDDRFPSYLPLPATPAIPRTHGVALDPSRVVVLGPGVRCVLPGSFRLPAASWVPAVEGATAHGAPCNALAPITLVATRDDALEPWAATLYVPCGASEGEVTGVFTVDLFALDGFPGSPGRVRLWAFAGSLVDGPFPMELVSEDELAPR